MNVELAKKKLEDYERKQTSQKSKDAIWKPKLGTQTIRFVPSIYNREDPFAELYFYYDLKQNKTIISPKSFNNPDPIIEFADKLKSTGEREDWDLAIEMYPKKRIYAPVLVRGEEEKGVRYYGFSKTVHQELLAFITDPEWGDITDPSEGRDVVIEYKKPEGAEYPKTTVRPRPSQSKVTDKKSVLQLIKEMPKLEDVWEEPSYDELKGILKEFIQTKEEAQAETSADVPNSPPETTANESTKTMNATDDVNAAFDDVFGDS